MPDTWLPTHSGRKIYVDSPRPEDIVLDDIAHSLAMQCRYNGHCKFFYSVAQHSVLVARCLRFRFGITDERVLRTGLLHDAAEYGGCGDMLHPTKRMIQKVDEFITKLKRLQPEHLSDELQELVTWHEIERRTEAAIARRFDLVYPFPPEIRKADLAVTAMEKEFLFDDPWTEWVIDAEPFPHSFGGGWTLHQLDAEDAKHLFLKEARELGLA